MLDLVPIYSKKGEDQHDSVQASRLRGHVLSLQEGQIFRSQQESEMKMDFRHLPLSQSTGQTSHRCVAGGDKFDLAGVVMEEYICETTSGSRVHFSFIKRDAPCCGVDAEIAFPDASYGLKESYSIRIALQIPFRPGTSPS